MDKIKEKLEKLRIEADDNLKRAEKAEADQKALKDAVSKQETLVQTLNNKVSLLTEELERTEKRADEVGNAIFWLERMDEARPSRKSNTLDWSVSPSLPNDKQFIFHFIF